MSDRVNTPTAKFSWKRGLKHAGLVLLIAIVVGAISAAFAPKGADMHKFGEGVGRLAGVAALIGLAASYLLQTGRTRAAKAILIGAAVLIVAVPVITVVAPMLKSGGAARPALPESVRVDLVRDADADLLVHPTLGVHIPAPGANHIAVHDNLRQTLDLHVQYGWAWGDAATREMTALMLDAAGADDVVPAQDFFDGAWDGLTSSLSAQVGRIDEAQRPAPLTRVASVSGLTIGMRALQFRADNLSYVAVLTVMRADEAAVIAALAKLKQAPVGQE